MNHSAAMLQSPLREGTGARGVGFGINAGGTGFDPVNQQGGLFRDYPARKSRALACYPKEIPPRRSDKEGRAKEPGKGLKGLEGGHCPHHER